MITIREFHHYRKILHQHTFSPSLTDFKGIDVGEGFSPTLQFRQHTEISFTNVQKLFTNILHRHHYSHIVCSARHNSARHNHIIYAIFWDRCRACFPGKKSIAQKHIQTFTMLRSGLFSRKHTR